MLEYIQVWLDVGTGRTIPENQSGWDKLIAVRVGRKPRELDVSEGFGEEFMQGL